MLVSRLERLGLLVVMTQLLQGPMTMKGRNNWTSLSRMSGRNRNILKAMVKMALLGWVVKAISVKVGMA